MSNGKIVVGPATHQVESKKVGLYGGRRSGKNNKNGGFNNEPAITYTKISQDTWDSIFPNGFKGPHLKNGEEI